MALLAVVNKWRHYLQRGHFIIKTDQQVSNICLSGLTKLLSLYYEVQYKRGTDNRVADALSRRQEEEGSTYALTSSEPTWMQQVVLSYEHNPFSSQLLTELIVDPMRKPNYTLVHGVIRYKQKIFMGRATNLRSQVFEVLHLSPLGGHSRQLGTYRRIHSIFYWTNIKQDVIR